MAAPASATILTVGFTFTRLVSIPLRTDDFYNLMASATQAA
jgi:hypothetical protein